MRSRIPVPFVLLAGVVASVWSQDAASKLPIDVPHDATVNFEAEAPGSNLLPVLQQLLSSGVIDGGSGHAETIVIKTGLGTIELTPRDVAELMRPVRDMHVVSYALPKDAEDPMKRQEEFFIAQGMQRVTNDNGFLLMRRTGDRYAAVMRQRDIVTVIRVDGMPSLGVVTGVVLRSIANGAQHASKDKHG